MAKQKELPIGDNLDMDVPKMDQVQNHAGDFMSMISLAIEKGTGIEAIQLLQQMQERWEDRKAKQAFARDLVELRAALPKVTRNKVNGQTKSKYATLEDINIQIDPILKTHGFATATKVLKQDAENITVQAELWHREGHVEVTQLTMPIDNKGMRGEPNKTVIHGISSTVTYLKRVAICALLNISTGDDQDGNLPGDKGIGEEQMLEELQQLLDLKREALKPDEILGIERVIKNKEKNAYIKCRKFLQSK